MLSSCACLALVLSSCSPDPQLERRGYFVYCTPAAKPFARALTTHAGDSLGETVVLAPLKERDLLSALRGLRAGHALICLGRDLPDQLEAEGFAVGASVLGRVGLQLVSTRAMSLSDAAVPGVKLGLAPASSALGKAVSHALPPVLDAQLRSNATQVSPRAGELVRLVKLGALDAALVWSCPPSVPGLLAVPVPGGADIMAVQLCHADDGSPPADRLLAALESPASLAVLGAMGVQTGETGDRQ